MGVDAGNFTLTGNSEVLEDGPTRQQMSASPKPDALPEEAKPAGRIRAAWHVLMGRRLVPWQLQAEWAEYQLAFTDLLTRFSTLLARQAKAEKKRASDLAATADTRPAAPPTPHARKAALRARVAAMRGLSGAPATPNGSHDMFEPVPIDAEDEP